MISMAHENRFSIVGVWQLLLAALFHGALCTSLFGVPEIAIVAGGATTDFLFFSGIAGAYLLLLFLAGLAEYGGRNRSAAFRGLAASLVFFPVYIVGFGRTWQLGLAGLVYSWVMAYRHLRQLRGYGRGLPAPAYGRGLPAPAYGRGLAAPGAVLLGENLPEADRVTADFVVFNSIFVAFLVLNEAGYGLVASLLSRISVWGFMILLGLVSLPFEYRHARTYEERFPVLRSLLLVGLVGAALAGAGAVWVIVLAGLRQFVAGISIWWHTRGGRDTWRFLVNRPASLLAISFAAAIFVGTLLLTLPAATPDGSGLGALDALFTATSATCVTGLIVVDTGTALSFFGQSVVLFLIQVGGLGIMTISIFIALLLGRSMGLRGEFALKEAIGEHRTRTAMTLLKFIVAATVVVEVIGAAVLFFSWKGLDGSVPRRVYTCVFHSVSAFCNAGFSLFSDSLCGFNDTPLVALTISVLIVLGGLGFGVLYTALVFRGGVKNNLHVRLVLVMTALLVVSGAVAFWLIECGRGNWDAGSGLSLLNAWFQSVTTRTAGFNTVDLQGLSHTTLMIMMVFMFIGAAPGSTAGGIKITTVGVLLLTIRSVLTGRESVDVARCRISHMTVMNAAALLCLALFVVGLGAFGLMLSHDVSAGSLLFEAFSAFGTVGLSLGATSELNSIGKLIITVLMFVGRTGPLTLLVIMRPRIKPKCRYPSADVMVG
jgi:trk system potassium uptake protein TrkH